MTGVGIGQGFKSEEWFKYRLEIFKKYTLASLLKQKNRGYLLWLSFRPEEHDHPLVKELIEYLVEKKMPMIITFHGLMYWDDKFTKGLKNRIMNLGRVVRQCYREREWSSLIPGLKEIFVDKNKSLLKRLELALIEMQAIDQFKDTNYLYITRLDSDDMLHEDAVDEIQRVQPFEGALVYKNGYVYNSHTHVMAEWNPKTNPPFHTIIFLGSIFFNPLHHLRYYKEFRSHEDVPRVFKTKLLEDGRYCVNIHSQHISSSWDHSYRGKDVDVKKLNEFI